MSTPQLRNSGRSRERDVSGRFVTERLATAREAMATRRFATNPLATDREMKEENEEAEHLEDEVLDESVQYAEDYEEAVEVDESASSEGANQQLAHPSRLPEREHVVQPYDPAPTPARGLLRHGSDASSAPAISKLELLDIVAEMRSALRAELLAELGANGLAPTAERRTDSAAERRTVSAQPSGAALRGVPPEDATVRIAPRASAVRGEESPPSSVSSQRSAGRMQKHLMDKIPSYSGTGGIAKLLDFADAMDNYILQDEDMSAASTLTLATSLLNRYDQEALQCVD
ncbi:hypothetical protein HDU89_002218, partial [Geranomyces variabilis]